MRRKAGVLIPLELAILGACLELFSSTGGDEAHGFLLAKRMKDREGARTLTSHGTLYKALDRLEKAGLLSSHWEDPEVAAMRARPRRRLYRITAEGSAALAAVAAPARPARPQPAPGPAAP